MTVETSRPDIVPIQIMRAIAALMVVMVHVDHQLARLGHEPLGWGWGARGVDIFFVISGFIMWISVARRPQMTATEFLRRRLERIVPLYWALTAFVVAVGLIAPDLLKTTRLDWWHTTASFLFLPAIRPGGAEFWPTVVPGWTLNFEMLFYALFAAAMAAAGSSARARACWIAGLLVVCLVLCTILRDAVPPLGFYARLLLLEFLAGIALAIVYLRWRVPSGLLWLACLALGIVLLWATASDAVALVGATMAVGGALFAPLPGLRGLRLLGDASYSLYLTQILTLPLAGLLWRAGPLAQLPLAVFVVFALAVAIAGALACYQWFEIPVANLLARRSRRAALTTGGALPQDG